MKFNRSDTIFIPYYTTRLNELKYSKRVTLVLTKEKSILPDYFIFWFWWQTEPDIFSNMAIFQTFCGQMIGKITPFLHISLLSMVVKNEFPSSATKRGRWWDPLWTKVDFGVPIVTPWKQTWLVSMKMQLWSLASLGGLRNRHCREPWCRSQAQLGSGVALAVAAGPIWPLAWELPCAAVAAETTTKKRPEVDFNFTLVSGIS